MRVRRCLLDVVLGCRRSATLSVLFKSGFKYNFQSILDTEEPVLEVLDESLETAPSVKSFTGTHNA